MAGFEFIIRNRNHLPLLPHVTITLLILLIPTVHDPVSRQAFLTLYYVSVQSFLKMQEAEGWLRVIS